MKDLAVSNAMELLEMYCGMILEGFSALEKECVYSRFLNLAALMEADKESDSDLRLPPALVEAASSIIYAAAFNEFQGLSQLFTFLFPC